MNCPDQSSQEVLLNFITNIVDNRVRTFGGGAMPQPVVRKKTFDSIHDQWLHALCSPDARMTGVNTEIEALSAGIAEWVAPLQAIRDASFRLCFRLEEPAENSDRWHVNYFLQPADDPSLLVQAEEVWKTRSRIGTFLKRQIESPQEKLLAGLGQAARVCPEIENSLRTQRPCGYETDLNGAHDFLMQKAWLLEQSGFSVLFPAWWTPKGSKSRVTLRAKVITLPEEAGDGLWNVPASMLFFPMHGIRRFVPMHLRVKRAVKGLDSAARQKKIFHLGFHPTNMSDHMEAMFQGLRTILEHASVLRDRQTLDFLPMKSLIPLKPETLNLER